MTVMFAINIERSSINDLYMLQMSSNGIRLSPVNKWASSRSLVTDQLELELRKQLALHLQTGWNPILPLLSGRRVEKFKKSSHSHFGIGIQCSGTVLCHLEVSFWFCILRMLSGWKMENFRELINGHILGPSNLAGEVKLPWDVDLCIRIPSTAVA